ncbi:MAG: selenocysteine-specific translation elongation factor [bacterium]
MTHIIIGTAGHIDHGKTALVKALTGVDTDRLKEEKERGLTIDLGFAHFGEKATIIDVPGHEKFIRNMVAGVSTIDFVLFVVAADDGVMPQSREHLDILKILQVKHGIIVITKMDLVDEEWLSLVKEDVRNLVQGSFLKEAPIIAVSSTTGKGVSELKSTIEAYLQRIQRKQDTEIFWMPVDRSFTMKGFGTVVTGSVLSGRAQVGDSLELLPKRKIVKIRGLQSHGHAVEKVTTGDRAAINLQAIDKDQVQRGDVLATPNYFTPSQRFDGHLQLLESAPRALKPRTRVRLHVGTTEVMARIMPLKVLKVAPGESAYVQFQVERPAVARRLDPFVIRQYSPTITIGGGVIIDANASRHKTSDPSVMQILHALEKENPREVIEGIIFSTDFSLQTLEQLSSVTATSKETVQQLLDELEKEHKLIYLKKEGQKAVVHAKNFRELKDLLVRELREFHKQNPTKLGISKAELHKILKQRIEQDLLNFTLEDLKNNNQLTETSGLISLKDYEISLSPEQQQLRKKIEQLLFNERYATSSEKEMAEKFSVKPHLVQEVLTLMIGLGEVIRVESSIYFHTNRVKEAKEKVVSFLNKNKEMTVSQFKDLLEGTSRKYAMPLLNYFDGIGVTKRVEDVRILGNR